MGRLSVAVALAMLAAGAAFAQPRFATESVDRFVERLYASRGFSGAVVIERDGYTVYSRGVGVANEQTRRTFTPDTRTDSASLAKPFTATLVLMLAAEGAIDLDAPVQRYVAEYPDATATVRDLLSHRAALPDYEAFAELFRAGKPVTTPAMLVAAGRTAPTPAPSATPRFHYCNLCYDTAALVVERVTGRTFEDALRARLFAPLDIDRAFVRPARLADMPADRAVGFRTAGGRTERFDAEDLEGFHGGGNLYASARDFARFARAFAIEAPVPGADVVKRALLPARLAADATSGLTLGSWYCAADAQRCHYRGAHRGFHNVMYWDRAKRLVVVYVSNSTLAPWLQPRIARELVAAAEGREPAWLNEPPLQVLTPDALARAAGSYDVAGVGRVALRAVGETAFARPPGGVEYPLYPVSSTLLYAPGLDAYVGLAPDGRLAWTTLYVDALGVRVKR